MPYRRLHYQRGRRKKSPQEKADQALREIYWQARREIGAQSQNLRIKLSDHLIFGIISAVISVAIVGFLFWGAFSPGRHPSSPHEEAWHAVVVLTILFVAIYFPGVILNYFLWPKILKIAGFIVVAVAFYFGLKAPTNPLYIIPYFLCSWVWVFAYFESGRLQHERLKFEDQKLLERGLDPKERDRLIGPP
jgi:NADH:ubiquinone oxidoreductase subunit 5 (subunit L)/multisubunit Na+/H+ antiporter MnhA subunit